MTHFRDVVSLSKRLDDEDGKYKEPRTTNFIHEKLKPILLFKDSIARCPFCRCMLAGKNTFTWFSCGCSKNTTVYRPVFTQGSPEEIEAEKNPLYLLSLQMVINKFLKVYIHVNYEKDFTSLKFEGKNCPEPMEIPFSNLPVDNEFKFRKKMKLYLALA